MKHSTKRNLLTIVALFAASVTCRPENEASTYNNLCTNVVTGIRQHPVNCYQYIECAKFVAQEITCPEGQIFSKESISCVDGDWNTCKVRPTCGEGYVGRMQSPGDCSKYYSCAGGSAQLEFCLEGYVYYAPFQVCLPGYEDHGVCKLYSMERS
ncbi:uncharacterized protein LOC131686923 [Topomyia yanbarensis]|uniref:uncharacterized protein LOC131686923 n=1 Tax=Topomyia yanbarensis TaxID=2498891 RepID=UPI00273B8C13|nr:uncharacterized protein LOC131686923 [Topomyia yanbarensis]